MDVRRGWCSPPEVRFRDSIAHAFAQTRIGTPHRVGGVFLPLGIDPRAVVDPAPRRGNGLNAAPRTDPECEYERAYGFLRPQGEKMVTI